MRFFNRFPKIEYKFGDMQEMSEYTNLSVYTDIIDQVKDDATTYEFYEVQDGERPDVVSDRLYGSSIYGWTFFILNDTLREQGWPLSSADLSQFIDAIWPGICFVISGTVTNIDSGITQHAMTEQFPIGSDVWGAISGANGKVYNRNVNLGQLFATQVSSTAFSSGEIIQDVQSGSPNFVLDTDSVSLARNAAHHYEDGDGNIVDIDPTTGIVAAELTEVTNAEYLENENDNISRIKVLKPELVTRFASLYKESINS